MQHIYTGSGAPTITPNGIGHHYVDTQNRVTYISVGILSALDWVQTSGAASQSYSVEYRTLTAQEELDKQIQLAVTPTEPNRTLLDILEGGGTATLGVDFDVIGDILSWAGGPLDGLLTEGDQIRVVFY